MEAQKKTLKFRNDLETGREYIHVDPAFDKYYIDREVRMVVQKTGDGEEDYILVPKVIETKRDIVQVVNADLGSVGVEAYMKSLALTGGNLQDVIVTDNVDDFTGFPETTGDMLAVGNNIQCLYASLPKEIIGSMSVEEFMNCDYMKLVTDYFNNLNAKKEVVEDKKDGDK